MSLGSSWGPSGPLSRVFPVPETLRKVGVGTGTDWTNLVKGRDSEPKKWTFYPYYGCGRHLLIMFLFSPLVYIPRVLPLWFVGSLQVLLKTNDRHTGPLQIEVKKPGVKGLDVLP